MALNFTIQRKRIEVPPDGDLTVRGLSSDDVAALVVAHGPVLRGLFEQVAADPGSALSLAVLLGRELLQEAPGFCTHAIALAAEADEEGLKLIQQLPFPVQLEALTAAAELTFRSDADLKKTVEIVVRAMSGATAAIQSLQG